VDSKVVDELERIDDVDQLVEDAFAIYVKDNMDRMTFEQFLAWCESTPLISEV
jgi:hypothetical protein